MKPYRVKRGSKFIGSFIVVYDGERVNLRTKDANEARRRAALVAKGLWPPSDTGAAAAVRDALEGKGPEPDEEVQKVEPVASTSLDVGQVSARVPAAAAGDESPDPVVPPVSPVDAAAAVNAAASIEVDERLVSDASAALADAGIDLAEIKAKMPSLLAKAHLWVQGTAARVGIRVVRGKWPAMVTLPDDDPLRDIIGKLDAAYLARLNLDVEKIGPGWFLLILSAVTTIAQVGGMLELLEAQEKAEAAAKAVN